MSSLRGKQNGSWLILVGLVMLAASLSFTSGGAAFDDRPAGPSVQDGEKKEDAKKDDETKDDEKKDASKKDAKKDDKGEDDKGSADKKKDEDADGKKDKDGAGDGDLDAAKQAALKSIGKKPKPGADADADADADGKAEEPKDGEKQPTSAPDKKLTPNQRAAELVAEREAKLDALRKQQAAQRGRGIRPTPINGGAAAQPPASSRAASGRPDVGRQPAKPSVDRPGRTDLRKQPPNRNGRGAVTPVVQGKPAVESVAVSAEGEIQAPTMHFPASQPDPDARAYRFDYLKTAWPDILTDFARMGGLVLSGDYESINGEQTFRSPEDFTFTTAMHALNFLLLERPLDKRLIERDGFYLKVWRLPDRLKKIPPEKMYQTFDAFEAANLDPYDMALTYFVAPEGWTAYQIIDQYRPQFDDYYGTQVEGSRIQLTGLVRDHYKFRDVIAALVTDEANDPDPGRDERIFELKRAKAATVQQMLRQWFDATGAAPGRRPRAGVNVEAVEAKQVEIVADPENNTLWIKAPPNILTKISEKIDLLDSGRPFVAPTMARVALEHAGAQMIAGALKPILAKRQSDLARKGATSFVPPEALEAVDVDIFPDNAGNSIILMGSRTGIESGIALVKEWDVPDSDEGWIIELEHGEAEGIATTLNTLLRSTPSRKGAAAAGPQVFPETGNRLLVFGTERDYQTVLELVKKLDVPDLDVEDVHFVDLEYAVPSEVAAVLEQISGNQTGRRAIRRTPQGKSVPVRAVQPGSASARFLPNDASKMLIVFCKEEDWLEFDPIIQRLDAEAKALKPEWVTFALKSADASDVVAMLDEMYPAQRVVNPKNPQAATQSHLIRADAYNNTVRVHASRSFIEEITPLIEKLDIAGSPTLTIIKLEYADVEEVADTLRESFGGGGGGRTAPVRRVVRQKGKSRVVTQAPAGGSGDVQIVAEPITRSLLITAPPKELEQIKSLVAEIETEWELRLREEQVIMVAMNRPAAEVAETLLALNGAGGAKPAKPGQKPSPAGGAGGSLTVIPSGNQVIIEGPRIEVAEAVQMFTVIDVEDQTPITRKYVVPDAEQAASAMNAMLGSAPTRTPTTPGGNRGGRRAAPASSASSIRIFPDTYDNTILVSAMPSDFPRIDDILATILKDGITPEGLKPEDVYEGPVFTIPLKHRDAYDIAFAIEEMVSPGGKGPKLDEGPTPRILMVSNCKPSQREQVIQLVEMWDVPTEDDTKIGRGFVTVSTEDKMSASMLATLLQQRAGSTLGRKVEIVSLFDSDEVAVVDIHEGEEEEGADAQGSEASESINPCVLPACLMEAVAAISWAETSEPSEGPIDPELCPICHQSPCVLPSRLVSSISSISTSALGQVTTPPDESGEMGSQPVEHNHPPVDSTAGTDSATASGSDGTIKLIPSPGGSLLIDGASEAEREMLEDMIEDLLDGKAPTVYRVFPLKYADVTTAGNLLQQVFTTTTTVPVPANPRAGGRQPTPQPAGAKAQPAAQPGRQPAARTRRVQSSRIKVIPDPRTRSLMVAAPLTDIPTIIAILRQIDRPQGMSKQTVRMFQLENLDAAQVVESLKEVLGLDAAPRQTAGRRGGRGGQPNQPQGQQQQIQLQGEGGEGTVVSAESVELTAEVQTNTIIAQAPPDTLNLISSLIEDLEERDNTTKVEMKRMELANARATDVAKIVREMAEQGGGGGRGGPGGRGGRRNRVSVNADTRTNSVIVSAQSKDLVRIEKIVADLDIATEGTGIEQFTVKGDPQSIANALKSVFVTQGSEVVITSDVSTGTVLVKADPKQMADIGEQIKKLDTYVQETQERRRITLKFANAEKMAEKLTDIFSAEGGRRGGRSRQPITIKGVKSGKMLVIQCSDEDFPEIERFVKEMDVPDMPIEVRRFELKYASAVEVDKNLTSMMAKVMARGGLDFDLDLIGVVPDAATNSLIVTGGPITFMFMDPVLREIDQPPPTDIKQTTMAFALPRNVDGNQIKRNIDDLYRASDPRKTGVERPTVTANAGSNIVTVLANPSQHEQIKSSIIDPVLQSVGDAPKDYQVHLQYVNADDAFQTLKNYMDQWKAGRGNKPQDTFAMTADVASNTILINCVEETKKVFDMQLAAIDNESAVGGVRETRSIRLENGKADEIARALTTQFQAKTVRDRRGVWPVTITPVPTSNSLIITAPSGDFEEILQMVSSVDVSDLEEGDRVRQVFKLVYSDPGAVSRTIQNLYRQVRNAAPRDLVTSADDWTTNSVIVMASPENMAEIAQLITDMDTPGDDERHEHVIDLSNSNSNDVANTIQQIFDARRGLQRQRTSATIRAIQGTTKIAVFASDKELEQIESLVRQIDVEGGRSIHTVAMPELVPAKTVAETINDLYGGSGRGRGDGPKAEYHEPTNTLLVHATEAEFAKIDAQVIQVISKQPTVGVLQVYKIQLKYAVADEVARTLQDFFDKKSGRGSRNNLPPWMRGQQQQQLEDQVSIIAEPTSNMLLCYCTETTKEMIDGIVADIDIDPSGQNQMEMVTLKYMDAVDMLDILTEYLKVSRRTPEDEGRRNVPWWYDMREEKDPEKTVLAGDMRLKAVEALNAIIVVGKPEGVADAVAKIHELDQPDENVNQPVSIQLARANATETADILTRLFEDKGQRGGRGSSAGYQATVIVAEEATNQLLVKGKRSVVNDIKKMAEQLDSQMEDESGGVQLVQVPQGRNVEELARTVEEQINELEENKRRSRRDYRPNLVKIGSDTTSNCLIVSGSKNKFEEVKALVDRLVEIGPVGNPTRRFIKLQTLSPAKAKELLDQIKEGKEGSGSNRGGRSNNRRGRGRSDASWQQGRRWDKAMQDGTGRPAATAATAATLPVFLAQLTWNTAVAQAEDEKKQDGLKTFTIRKTNQDQDVDPAVNRDGRNTDPRRPVRGKSPLEMAQAATRPAGIERMSVGAQQALRKRLSGAPVEIHEAGKDGIIVEATEEDLAILESIIDMLDSAIEPKTIEYVALKNAQAKELAKTLQDVFSKIEKVGERTVQPEDQVDIIADPGTNGLYIAATAAKMQEVLDLIEKNEMTAELKVRNVKTIQLKNRRVTEAGETLKKMVAAYLKQKGMPADAIQIEIDPQTNSVFVTAGETDLSFVQQIIDGLDAELEPTEDRKYQVGEADIMVVPLRVAAADTLGLLLNGLLEKAATGDTPMKDFIRRFRLLDENGEPIASVDLNRPIVVFGEPDSNSLIIASTRENCLIMKQVALAFDKEPARAAVEHRVLTMVHADATEVATQLDEMLTASESLTQRPGKSEKFGLPDGATGALVYQAVVKADARTNQIVVIGRPEAVTLLTELAAGLDIKGLDVMPFEIIELEYANAASLETALTDLIEKRAEALPAGTGTNADKAEKVVIKGDPRSKSLIIAARRGRMEELRGLIKQLDVAATALVEDIRTITLRNGNAAEMAEKLKTLWEERQSQQESSSGFKLEVPAIVADARSNSLIVAASKGDFEAIEAVVAKIEALELNPMFQIYVVALKYNSASQLAPAFTALFQKRAEMRTADGSPRPEDEVEIQVDEVTNSLIVAASRENVEVLRMKVAELDQEMGIPGQVEFFVCTNVDAFRVKDTLEELFADDGPFPRTTGSSDVIEKRRKVTITVDNRANMLIVSASPENMALARQIYTRMESVQTPWDVAITKLMTIEHGDAVRIAAQVQDHFDKLDEVRSTGSGENQQAGFKITVFSDERSNRIVIGGTKDGIDRAVVLVQKLDVPPGEGIGIQVYGPLKNAPVARVAEMLRNVFQERNQSRDQGGPQVQNVPVTIEPNERNQTMLISASREDHSLIKDVVERLDRPSSLLEMVRLFPLKESRADKVKEILDELFQAARGGAGSENLVGVTVDNRTNAVLVTGPPGELDNLDGLIAQLDTAEPIGAVDIRVYRCENEDASKMVELLNEILTGAATSGGGGAENEDARSIQSLLVRYEVDGKGGEEVLQAMQQNVRISYNERSNTVVVVAPPASQRLMKSLIEQLDRIEKRAVLVKVFTLINADATAMVELLESMFAQDSASEQERAFQQGREFEVEGGLSSTGAVPTAASQAGTETKGTFGRPKTTFTADERTNSIVAAGWPEDIDIVADIIDQLDSQSISDRDHSVYTLINAEAPAVEAAVQAFWEAESQRLQSVGDQMSPQRRMEQEVEVVAHEESNQLIVSVAPRYKQAVFSIIEQLDLPPPQVMIQVMIAEVTLDDRFEMGLEFALQQLRFSETAIPGGNGVLQSTHFDVVGGTDLGAAGAGLGGFSFTITGEDFNFLVRALQADSRLEVIQRPMIMCQDNMEANITIGQRVPFVRNTTVSDSGQVNANVEYEEIGIILDVEPHINPDGWVYLRVAPEISAITDSTIDIGNGVTAPIFTNRTADTTVAVKDGETIVIGGLITTTENESESKVPFLGDIPGLGVLFRATSRTKSKTELLIAMTPRIVRTVEDGRRMSIDARDEGGILTPELKQSPLFQGLRVVPEDALDNIDTLPDLPGLPPPPVGPRQYGPSVPTYGPLLPNDAVITRNDAPRSAVYGVTR